MGGGYQAAADRKAPVLRSEIDHWCTFRSRRWKAPAQLREFMPVGGLTDDGSSVGRPDIVPWFQVGRRLRPPHRDPCLAEGREIVVIRNAVPEIVAHRETWSGGTCYSGYGT